MEVGYHQTNILFLIAGLIIIAVVFFHFLQEGRHDDRMATRVFLAYMVIGAFDIVLDIATSVFSDEPLLHSLALLEGSYTAFYLLQSLVPLLVLVYSVLLCSDMGEHGLGSSQRRLLAIAVIPTLAMVFLVISNVYNGILFSFDSMTHAYVHGDLYEAMYLYAVCFCVFALVYIMLHRGSVRRKDVLAVWELCALMGVCAIAQLAFDGQILMTGFGIGLGILVLYATASNPMEQVDPLTGCMSLGRFRAKVTQLIAHEQRFSVALISLDYLKRLNPILGPTTVDGTILLCSNELKSISRGATVYRLRRTLFGVIVRSDDERARIVGFMRDFFKQKHVVNGMNLQLSASVGSIPADMHVDSADELQNYIEYLIEQAHRTGSWPSSLSSHQGALEAFRRSQLVHRCIEEALENDFFEVRLQPVYSLKERAFTSAEALSRLNHPGVGLISPAEFIPVAENEGYVTRIGRLQFKKICSLVAENREMLESKGIRNVKVNLSAVELLNMDLGDYLLDAMESYGLEPSLFQFEITESTATSYTNEVNQLIKVLLKAGCAICMDDFGSGYANFTALTRLPFSVVKIDISLLNQAMIDDRAALLYHGILSMGSALGLASVCEGVETADQVLMLEKWGADQIQGFFFARPMSFDAIREFDTAACTEKLDAAHVSASQVAAVQAEVASA